MMTDTPKPLRVLFCSAVLQNFFDLPAAEIGKVWAATGEMLRGHPRSAGRDRAGHAGR
jgi:hypothetical protein